ncbi:phage tail protein [Bacteroides thetaiotaomicron]|uniref:phage tail protein n=1 Tax=Bacteroides thetaiotaomicron TaxID=818 RepID=UPI001D0819F5|nr:phage tail protein [Bacteroides thetaiotaomicron]MCB7308221.1 phage tail protein [Bacteroides thetaiotaomicron]MCG4871482.1 phage tail protein [Bacteroides thetaiotaomicron]
MEQIIVRHPDGTTALLTSRARKSGVTKAEQSITLLGADTVAITVKSATPLTFHLGDQIDVYGKTYTLNQLPGIKKTGNRNFEYTLTFEGVQYELIDVQFLLPDDTVLDSFTGDLEDFLGILIGNLTRVYPGKWVLGVYPANTEYKTLTYTEKNCLEVLQDLCEQYSTEFEITQANGVRTLNIKTAGVNFPYTFRYGRTGGLYELTRQNINSKNVVTRLYVYGGSSNLGDKYRYTRLCLPGKAKNASYIEDAAAIAAYGLKENTKIFDDIRPERYGEVTAAGSAYYAFKDATMNFDLNEKDSAGNTKWLIDGATAKVKFTTGNLAGYEFDIHKYDHATKEIQVVPFTDENGMKFPSETSAAFQFGVGDKYFFTDINLPDTYKTDAENKLLAEGNKAITEYSQPQVQYGLSIDENFIRQFAGELTVVNLFAVGDYIPVEDEDIGVNKSVRITAFTRDLLREYKYNITLGDSVTKTTITRVIEDLQKIDNVIEINDLADPSKARRNWKASQEVLANVFDPEGHYYSEKIKPLSIETTMLATGARSQQFVLQNTRFEPNYEGNPNTVKVVGGTLVHYTIAETVKSWQLNTATFSNLVSGTVYYIYARCQKTGTAGNIVFDTVQRAVDGDPTYYYFLIGSLSSVITDTDGNRPARLIALTYGATTINGRFLATGRIQSGDGQTYFDLDAGEIGGNIKFRASDGTLKDVAELEQSDIEYLRDAFKDARTEIEGGVALSGFIGVRDTEQNVAAAMAGYNPTGESDYPLIFAGAQQGNVEYYGWTSNSYTHIYTQSATPSNGDNCFDNKGSVVGTVTNIVGAQIFALSTTGETYQRNTGIDFTAKTPSAMEGNRAKFRVYKDGRCVSNYFETSGSYKTIYTKTNCPPSQFTTVLAVSENCYMALTAGAQFGVLMEANEDHNGYNCALYNSSSYPCTVVKGTKSSYTHVGVLSPGELMEFVNIYGTWILRNHTRYSTKAES